IAISRLAIWPASASIDSITAGAEEMEAGGIVGAGVGAGVGGGVGGETDGDAARRSITVGGGATFGFGFGAVFAGDRASRFFKASSICAIPTYSPSTRSAAC